MNNLKEPDNCDPVWLCTSTDNLGLVCVAYSSMSQDMDSSEGKGKKTSRSCVISKQIV